MRPGRAYRERRRILQVTDFVLMIVPEALTSYGDEALVHALALQKNARTMAKIVMSRSRVMAAARDGLLALVPETQALQRLNRFFHKGWKAGCGPGAMSPGQAWMTRATRGSTRS